MHFLNKIEFPKKLSDALQLAFPQAEKKYHSALENLWPQLAKELGENKKNHYSESKPAVTAYAAYYLAANALKVPLILEEHHLLTNYLPKKLRVLDIGCGPGTTLWGLAWWCEEKNISLEYTGIEASSAFLTEAKRIADFLPFKNFSANWHNKKISADHFLSENQSSTNANSSIKFSDFDLVVFSNSIGEIFPTSEQMYASFDAASLLPINTSNAKTSNSLRPALLLILEPGSQKSSRRLLELRECLRPHFPQMLPCIDNRPCGALKKETDWCHEEIECIFPAWHSNLGKAAGLKKEALLFSYLLLPLKGSWDNWPVNFWRMVSQRLERKGQTEAWFCTSEGKICARVQKSKINPLNAAFLEIKRGDLSPPLSLSEKNDIIEYPPRSNP